MAVGVVRRTPARPRRSAGGHAGPAGRAEQRVHQVGHQPRAVRRRRWSPVSAGVRSTGSPKQPDRPHRHGRQATVVNRRRRPAGRGRRASGRPSRRPRRPRRRGSLPQVMPPPAHRCSRSPSAATVRMVRPRSRSPSVPTQPSAPMLAPRPTGSSAGDLGQRGRASARRSPSRPGRPRAAARPGRRRRPARRTPPTRPATGRTSGARANSSSTRTEPVPATRARSLRSRSTIITCSARSLAEASSSRAARPRWPAGCP